MIKALKELFNNGIPSYDTYKVRYNVWDKISETFLSSNFAVTDWMQAYKGAKQAGWKASQVAEVGTDIDGNPFVAFKQPWIKGTRTKKNSGMIHGEVMEWETTEEYDQDNYVTYTKLENVRQHPCINHGHAWSKEAL